RFECFRTFVSWPSYETIQDQSILRNPLRTVGRTICVVENHFRRSRQIADERFFGAPGSLLIAEMISVRRPAEANALAFHQRAHRSIRLMEVDVVLLGRV